MEANDQPKSRVSENSPAYHFDFVDANPNQNQTSSETVDAAGYAETSSGSEPLVESELLVQPIPTRKGSFVLDTPLSPRLKYYPMKGGKRGKVLIFNQVSFDDSDDYPERTGTEKDVERLHHTLTRLGFQSEDILVYEDYSFSQIQRTAIILEADKDLHESDCLVVIILTHGEDGDYLMARDGKYHLYQFIENFTPTALNSMAGKPKLFIVQACRGRKLDRGVQLRAKLVQCDSASKDQVDSQSEIFTYPEFADLLIFMSSHHGHYSFRNETGSWLIQELCNIIEGSDLESSSIYDILTDTNDAVSKRISHADGEFNKKKQIPSIYSTLTKRLFFKPTK